MSSRHSKVDKANETPEQRLARRLAKKEAKERRRREERGWDKEYMGYTNDDNPFGDNNLLDPFVWHKKRQQEGFSHLDSKMQDDRDRSRILENRRELEKVKQRRKERELEQAAREEEQTLMQRDREAQMFKVWEEQEDSFHLKQAKQRSKIRIRDGRAKPIDLLAKYASTMLEGGGDSEDVDVNEPYTVLNGLSGRDLEDLIEDIKVYIELEEGKNLDFWKDITTIAEEELNNLQQLQGEKQRQAVNPSVLKNVEKIIKGKTYSGLLMLKKQVAGKIAAKQGDVSFWEYLQQHLKAAIARARLREAHQQLLKDRLQDLRTKQLQQLNDEKGAGLWHCNINTVHNNYIDNIVTYSPTCLLYTLLSLSLLPHCHHNIAKSLSLSVSLSQPQSLSCKKRLPTEGECGQITVQMAKWGFYRLQRSFCFSCFQSTQLGCGTIEQFRRPLKRLLFQNNLTQCILKSSKVTSQPLWSWR